MALLPPGRPPQRRSTCVQMLARRYQHLLTPRDSGRNSEELARECAKQNAARWPMWPPPPHFFEMHVVSNAKRLGSISCARSAFVFLGKLQGCSQSETRSTRLRREEQHVRTRAWLHLLRAQRLFFFGLVRSLGRGNQSETHVALRRPRLPLRAQHSLCVGNIAECHTQETRFSGRCVTGKTEIFSAAASGPRSGISAAAAKLHGSNPPRLDSSSTRAGQR